jgi:hypothetical protein
MQVHVYFRRKDETDFRDLGNRDMGSVPPEDDIVVINLEGQTLRAKVEKTRTYVASKHQPARDPDVYLGGI